MRLRIDCAFLRFNNGTAITEKSNISVHANGRLYIHDLKTATSPTNPTAIAGLHLILRRFDAALVSVDQSNLVWARKAFVISKNVLRTPILGLTTNLTAPAIKDLFQSGMSDFIRYPLCTEELRTRIEQLRKQSNTNHKFSYPDLIQYNNELAPQVFDHAILDQNEYTLKNIVQDSASHGANSKDSFNNAKALVVKNFERAYIVASLMQSSGNIALAARNAKKHRRAYWALMQKHNIDASLFRKSGNKMREPEDE